MHHEKSSLLAVSELVDYEAQPFKVLDDESMDQLVESIKQVGVLVPIIVRQLSNGLYEIISGHRRKRACEIAGIKKIPAVIKELNDDEAAILLVDSNLQRENLLPSEKAYAYKLKLDAIKHQGKKNEQDSAICESTDIIGVDSDKSGRQIRRYIRLTELIIPLLDKVDLKIIPVVAGAEVSFLNVKLQVTLNEQMDFMECKLNTRQAKKLKQFYLDSNLDEDKIEEVLLNQEKCKMLRINYYKLKKYFPQIYTAKQCEKALWEILDEWYNQHCA